VQGLSILFYPPLQPLLFLAEPRLFVGGLVTRQEIIPESAESAIQYGASYFTHQAMNKAQVMNGG
jgi:hypothetical protein